MQDAFVQAIETWPIKGQPRNPQAWLLTTARRRLVDKFRRDSHHNHSKTIQAIMDCLHTDECEHEADSPIPDERLKLMFVCCHPALAREAQVALTLKTLSGLQVKEIARAFLVPEVTMRQRLTRAKQKISKAGIAYEVPDNTQLIERLPAVLSVIYLIFNESYTAYEGQTLSRQDLADEAIRLATILYDLLPRPDVAGLLCLMTLHNARRAARQNTTDRFIPLEKQDRSLWNATEISQAKTLLLRVMAQSQPEPYQTQAAISALHSEAATWEATDWPQIILLYEALYQMSPSPVVKLNQIVAIAHSGKAKAAMTELNTLKNVLIDYQPFYAARAAIAKQLNQISLAIADYEQAIILSKNNAERDYLIQQKNRLVQDQ